MMREPVQFTDNGIPYSVQIVADSVNSDHDRLTTFVLKYPRFIHAQMMTHRCLSRNAQSSRAMPTKKLQATDLVLPLEFGANQAGMHPGERLGPQKNATARQLIRELYEETQKTTELLASMGVHKQWVNRYLEPFTTITAIYTGDDGAWSGVFNLRCHPDAQEEIQVLMNAVRREYQTSVPEETDIHLPFHTPGAPVDEKVAVARCARVSYLNFEGSHDPSKDHTLHGRLLNSKPPHLSPFEHVAYASPGRRFANFYGWQSYRHALGY